MDRRTSLAVGAAIGAMVASAYLDSIVRTGRLQRAFDQRWLEISKVVGGGAVPSTPVTFDQLLAGVRWKWELSPTPIRVDGFSQFWNGLIGSPTFSSYLAETASSAGATVDQARATVENVPYDVLKTALGPRSITMGECLARHPAVPLITGITWYASVYIAGSRAF